MSDVDGVPEVEGSSQLGNVGGIGVHLVACVGLVRAAVAAAVMRDHAVALRQEEQHLVVPVIRRERPAVMEHDGLCIAGAPILVEDAGAVGGGQAVARHGRSFRFSAGARRDRQTEGCERRRSRDQEGAPRDGELWSECHVAGLAEVLSTWTTLGEAGRRETWRNRQ